LNLKNCTVSRDILNEDKLQEASMLPETFKQAGGSRFSLTCHTALVSRFCYEIKLGGIYFHKDPHTSMSVAYNTSSYM
jgi:hypothetical protein